MSAELLSEKSATSIPVPGAAQGQYLVIRCRSSFEHKKSGLESIIMRLEGDGVWRVWNYETPNSPLQDHRQRRKPLIKPCGRSDEFRNERSNVSLGEESK